MSTPARTYRKLSPDRRAAFLDRLAGCGNVTAAADAIGISRDAAYKLRDRDTAFGDAWTLALDRYAAALEAELHARVFDGVPRPVFQRGELVGHEVVKSDRLLEIALRARLPETYSERVAAKLEHSGSAGVLVVASAMTPADWVSAFAPKEAADVGRA
ncbi:MULTISPECIES: hypothetical protein [Methylobacterium]|uniref:Terminase n=2 Tax=Pseudomonadota TaxID=1224 RepID=A0ABQ4SWT0_9HYPH|nr:MULTISPECIES: hypothetical protein [Methylobacterium]PIU07524.1 MAG: hypothetical protein COT56_04700 [Methylobacterium sp. CG09_land_8_20_14_0_10_71_15]PIU13311.1 MAG: hypothetical protein COT28_11840 [Methylobacterium sp. CG08_land_8_20_14_0_20_71_15]GBU17777.1 hypothetical protein AwMethylo_19920 [Methylobacterium sp.]GJE06395.1 hypothetical protein AOPFMNJM_1711 [Methylobacterium jeotgali]